MKHGCTTCGQSLDSYGNCLTCMKRWNLPGSYEKSKYPCQQQKPPIEYDEYEEEEDYPEVDPGPSPKEVEDAVKGLEKVLEDLS